MWTGTIARCVSLEPEPAQGIGVRTLIQYVTRFKSTFFSLAVAAIFVDAVELSVPLTFMVIMDSVIVNRAAATLDVVILIFVVMVTFGGLLSQFSDRVRANVGRHLGFELSSRFARDVLSLPTEVLKGVKGSEILSRIGDLSPVHRLVTDLVAIVWVDALFVLACLGIGFYLSKFLGLVMLMRLPFYLLGAYVAMSRVRKVLQQNVRSRRESTQLIVDTMDGIETIKARHAEDYIGRRIENKLGEVAELADDGTDFRNMVDRYSAVVDRIAVAAFLWIGTYQVIGGDLTAGQIMAVYLINRLMMRPMNRLARTLYDFQRVAVGIEEVNRVLSKEPEVNSRHLIKLGHMEGRIRFDSVRFRYPNNESAVLRGISFQIEPGEIVGIVGRSGSGKSTILKLLQRLYLPSSGRIEIDDTGIEILHPHWLRERLGCVPQDCWLFGQSVSENIRLGSPAISRADVMAAAQLACAHEFIVKMPKGYDTVIHGAGTLSGGERQRIAIARAIVHRPKLLLFDESTSALDHETEAAVLKNMETVFKDRTVIIVAHRVSALPHVQRVLVVEDGQISQIGTPMELMTRAGYFATMVGDQFKMLETLVRGADQSKVRGTASSHAPEVIAPLLSRGLGA
jgi:ATP-binding cassette, subfamily B, bacterial HlyB/CyaB